MISLYVSSFRPPQASNSLVMGVPMGHSMFLGSMTPEPDTVTILFTTGRPSYTAR